MLSDVQGQSEGVRVLRRVVEGSLKTPLLLVGKEGVGRKYSVIEAAREFFTKGNSNSLHSKRIDQSTHPDLIYVNSKEGKEIGIEAIRDVVSLAETFPSLVPTRYVIIDGADEMTVSAADALLKTLEEQPVTTRFFLLAKSQNIIPTIKSRCGLVKYKPLPEQLILERIKHLGDPVKALVCTRLGEGSIGLAYQFLVSGRLALRNKMVQVLEATFSGKLATAFSLVDSIDSDLSQGIYFLSHILKDTLLVSYCPDRVSNMDILDTIKLLSSLKFLEKVVYLLEELPNIPVTSTSSFHFKSLLACTVSSVETFKQVQ